MGDTPAKDAPRRAESKLTVDFERGIPFLVAALGNKLSAIASASVRRNLGVGLMEWRILALLAVEADATPARVSQVAGVDKSVVSRAATSLERRGLITIEPETSSSRQTRFAMTPAGEAMHERGVQLSYASNEHLLHGFTPEEREKLAEPCFVRRPMSRAWSAGRAGEGRVVIATASGLGDAEPSALGESVKRFRRSNALQVF